MQKVENYLKKLRHRNAKLARLKNRYEKQEAVCTKLNNPPDNDRVQTSIDIHRAEKEMAKLAQIGVEIDDVDQLVEEACNLFNKLTDDRFTTLMYLRYIDLLGWDEINEIMSISRSWSFELHDRALEQLNILLNYRTIPD